MVDTFSNTPISFKFMIIENLKISVLYIGNTEFQFCYKSEFNDEHKANIYSFNIWKTGDNPNDFKNYSLLLKEMPNGTDLKVIDLFANKYKGQGISIPMLLKTKDIFNKRIIPSSNRKKSHSGEANWKEAIDRVWNPMMVQGLAKYDEADDYYYIL